MKKYITDINGNPRLIDITEADIQKEKELLDKNLLEIKKTNRQNDLNNLKVIYQGMEFDGDEISQGRISRALLGLTENEKIDWKLANNEFVKIDKTVLINVLRLAGEEQTKLWIKYS